MAKLFEIPRVLGFETVSTKNKEVTGLLMMPLSLSALRVINNDKVPTLASFFPK